MSTEKPVTNDELLEAVSSYGESGNAQQERLVFLTPRLHVALVEHFRNITKGWQPISTMPKDGRTVLLNRDGSQRVYTGRWATAGAAGFVIDTHGQQRDPARWMPLPPAPTAK